MPAVEPSFLLANGTNYPPETARALRDLLDRTPFVLTLPFTYATANAAVLYTVPTGYRLWVLEAAWEITTSLTGGVASAIGVSSDDASYNTQGDILGGAGGDVAATLVSTGLTLKGGTLGAKFGSNGKVLIAAGKVLRFDRITSAFTAGAGNIHVRGCFLPTS